MKLNMLERQRLLEVLPIEGTRLNLKIVRKLRESLSFSEGELAKLPILYEFACREVTTEKDGISTPCEFMRHSSETPVCKEHKVPMLPTGNWRVLDVSVLMDSANDKDVYMGAEAIKLAASPLKLLEDTGKLTEQYISLYDKFFPPREEEEDAVPDS